VELTEIRTKLSATPQADRYAKIASAIERGNDEVAAAVLNADRFFSDFLSDVEVSALQALWAKTRMPESVARLAVLESDFAHVERAGKIFQIFVFRLHVASSNTDYLGEIRKGAKTMSRRHISPSILNAKSPRKPLGKIGRPAALQAGCAAV
jgi:hypothetical protein